MSSETSFNWSIGEVRLNPINDLPKPSDEQAAIIDGAKTGRNIKVQAFAGTGKTTTIKMLAQELLNPSAYIAFNKGIVDEVSNKLPDHVWCSTAHSLAFKEVITGRSDMEAKFNGRNKLWYHSNVTHYIGGEIDKKLLAIVIRMVKIFCKSIDTKLSTTHIGLRDELTLQKMTTSEVETLVLLLVQYAEDNRKNDDVLQNIKSWYSKVNPKPKPLMSKYLTLWECQGQVKIDSGRAAFMDMYKEFTSIVDIELFLEEENNDTIARPLALCKRFNFNLTSIKAAVHLISRLIDPSASIVLTTAHKSKGQEWDKVTLCDDFNDAIEREKRNGNGTKHEWNLVYVAFTRAKKELSLSDSIKLLLGVVTTNQNEDIVHD